MKNRIIKISIKIAVIIFLSLIFVLPFAVSAQSAYTPLAPIRSGDTEYVGTTVSGDDLTGYFNGMFKLGIALAVGLAVVMIIIGGVEYMSTDVVGKKEDGQGRINAALLGLVVALGSYMLLNTIDPDLLNADLKLNYTIGGAKLPTGIGVFARDPGKVIYKKTIDNTEYTTYDNGNVEAKYPTQHIVTKDKNGNTKTQYPDGTYKVENKNKETVEQSNPPPEKNEPPPPEDTTPPFEEPPLPEKEPPPTPPPSDTPPCEPGKPSSGGVKKVYELGDSITKDGLPAFFDDLEKRGITDKYINGVTGRTLGGALNDFKSNKTGREQQQVVNADRIIIELGTNDESTSPATFEKQANELLTAIRAKNTNNAQIYWVKVFAKTNNAQKQANYAEINKIIDRLPGVTPINVPSNRRPDGKQAPIPGSVQLSSLDGVHPTPAGYKELAKQLAGKITGCEQ